MELNTDMALFNENMDAVNDAMKKITEHHKMVSNIDTPKTLIKKKMGLDYVEYSYMRDLADKYYPGWSFKIVSDEYIYQDVVANNNIIKYLIGYKVTGRLIWYDNGIKRTGDMSATHRVQFKKTRDNYVDIGNDTKAAVTDCIKKAMNQYMNIADDVYKKRIEDLELTKKEVEVLKKYAGMANKRDIITEKINSGEINALNYIQSINKLRRQIKEAKDE